MNGFLMLLSFVCFSIGISGFVLSILLFSRYKNRNLFLYTITMGFWSLNFFIIRFLDILQLQFWNIIESSSLITNFASHITWSCFNFFVLITVAAISGRGMKRIDFIILGTISLFILLPLESSLFSFMNEDVRIGLNYLQILLHFVILYWAAVMLRSIVASINKKDVRKMYNRLVILLFVFFPILALELMPFIVSRYPFGLGIYPVFYMLVNVVFLRFISNFIYFPKLDRQKSFTVQQENLFSLTKREIHITELLMEGKSYKQISEELCIALETVKTHVSNIYSKSQVSNKMELMAVIRN